MSRKINQPVASVKLTNVATVRLTVGSRRFEVACYKNKVLDYRAGLETDLSEVLQTFNIFTNVAKGEFAKKSDLKAAFGEDMTTEQIAVHILQHGRSLQISEAERTQMYESTLTQIATWIASNTIHKHTGKPYTVSQIKHALTTANHKNSNTTFTVQPHKPIKQQYLQALKYIISNDILPIQRAAMELKIIVTTIGDGTTMDPDSVEPVPAIRKALADAIMTTTTTTTTPLVLQIEKTRWLDQSPQPQQQPPQIIIIPIVVDPSLYRPIQEIVDSIPNARLEIVRQQVFAPAAVTTTTTTTTTTVISTKQKEIPQDHDMNNDDDEQQQQQQQHTTKEESNPDDKNKDDRNTNQHDNDDETSSSGSSDEQWAMTTMTRKNQRKAKKKQQRKAQRKSQRTNDSDSHDEEDDSDKNHDTKKEISFSKQKKGVKPNKGSKRNKEQLSKTKASSASQIDAEGITLAKMTMQSSPKNKKETTMDGGDVQDHRAGPESSDETPRWTCNTCLNSTFASQAEHRAHFRSDWHRFNLKLKLQNAPPVDYNEFRNCDAESFFQTYE
jgi:ribosome maturation protein SDO1